MRVVAVNGSPRKNFNTATLLKAALEGAGQAGAQTELINLGDYVYTGCKSCLACKSRKLPQTGKCVLKDSLTPVLEASWDADVLLLGSPVYFYAESAYFRAYMERFIFPMNRYTVKDRSLFKGRKQVGLFYTMNITEEEVAERKPPFPPPFALDTVTKTEFFLTRAFGNCETLLCTDTKQVNDYSAYYMDMFNPEKKQIRHDQVFLLDCEKALRIGRSLVEKASLPE